MKKLLYLTCLLFLVTSVSYAEDFVKEKRDEGTGKDESIERQADKKMSANVDLTLSAYMIAANRNNSVGNHNPSQNKLAHDLSRTGLFPDNPGLFQAFMGACHYTAPWFVEVINQLSQFEGVVTKDEFLELFEQKFLEIVNTHEIPRMYGTSSLYTCTHTHQGEGGNYSLLLPLQRAYLPEKFLGAKSSLTTHWGLNCDFGTQHEPQMCGMKISFNINTGSSIRDVFKTFTSHSRYGEITKKVDNIVQAKNLSLEEEITLKKKFIDSFKSHTDVNDILNQLERF